MAGFGTDPASHDGFIFYDASEAIPHVVAVLYLLWYWFSFATVVRSLLRAQPPELPDARSAFAIPRRVRAFAREGFFVLLAAPAIVPAVLVIDPLTGLGNLPVFMLPVGLGMLALVCALPIVHRLERYPARVLLGTVIADQPRRAAWVKGAFFTALHVLGGLSLGLSISLAIIVLSELSSPLLHTVYTDVVSSPDMAWVYGQALTSTTLRAFAVLLFLGAFVYAIGYLVSVRSIAKYLFGPTTTQRLEESEAERRRLEVQNEMARDIHDSVGHALTIASLQAESGRAQLHGDPAAADDALTTILHVCTRAQADLDDVLRILRTGHTESSTRVRDLGSIDGLLADAREAGLRVDLDMPAHLREVGSPFIAADQSRALYRIVQETMTNALRYAEPKQLDIRLVGDDESGFSLLAHNPVPNSAGSLRPVEARERRGLQGIRARAQLLGGDASAYRAGDRFIVEVRLPGTDPDAALPTMAIPTPATTSAAGA